ncbi:MAG TPA: Crp/Fnr family transcriptional regulator [Phycisphaerae bacterium]|nr:Crp/Fnr family transcriptional regulator [Phycisphaerae bacterium]
MSLAELLKHVMLFSGLEDEDRRSVAALAIERRIPAGQVLFREGQAAEGFYVVLDGRVKVYKLSPDGRQQILHVFGPGQAFAEAAMFAGETFPAFAESLAESRVAFFPRDRFLEGLRDNPALAAGLIASLARLCRQLTTLIGQIALRNMTGRLARYLADLARRKGTALEKGASVRLDLPKGELARHLGVDPATLSRALGRLASADLITVEGRVITFCNGPALEALASGQSLENE